MAIQRILERSEDGQSRESQIQQRRLCSSAHRHRWPPSHHPIKIEFTEPGHRHRCSPSSDHFLGIFSLPAPSSTESSGEHELNEAEIFWTADFIEPNHSDTHHDHHRRLNFGQSMESEILSVLPQADRLRYQTLHEGPVLCRKPIPSIPRPPEREYLQSLQGRNLHHHQSAQMKVPVLSNAMAKRSNVLLLDLDDDDREEADMLPPHEIVARGSGVLPKTTFSIPKGVGRTLKGRDLRQVRNAIWRKTGFLD
ncbi:hypothetical protein I3842_06G017900 [Carya illinoinensis]|uniref:Senescence regulator n=1 Tax=Carya illinoinensis TaxID=32201 RepID=A0A922JFX5_CARIL|nr:hypothetical protein I3842_06G017900 [Carya illinoinensis]